jgi:multisubunit Na+/H+ antiporter MnhB subunit
METIELISLSIDILIALSLIWLALTAICSKNLFNAIVMFILFGLIMALAWIRLNAPDVALAEAALGAGITGAILLETLRKLKAIEPLSIINDREINQDKFYRYLKLFTGLILSGLALLTINIILPLADNNAIKSPQVFENMAVSGVENPVTAVLLNFRGYDTFLEVFVLYVALLGAWSIGDIAEANTQAIPKKENFILVVLIKLLTPMLIMVATYILWVGSFKPGGAFQSGSILAGAAVFMGLAGWQVLKKIPAKLIRILVIIGPLYFVSVLVFTTFIQGTVLKYSIDYSGVTIFSIEALSTISIFIILFLLYLGDEIKAYPLEKK